MDTSVEVKQRVLNTYNNRIYIYFDFTYFPYKNNGKNIGNIDA